MPNQGGLLDGQTLLAVFGLVVAAILVFGLFEGNFLALIAKQEVARGLITFLFSLSTVAIFLLIAIATYYTGKADLFNSMKDLLTLMVGIFGTILGFYFGSLTNPPEQPNATTSALSLANVRVPNVIVAPGDKTTITATILGGTAPFTYDVYFTDPTGTVSTDRLQVRDKPAKDGKVAEEVEIPADLPTPASFTFRLVAHDAKGNQAQTLGTLIVHPKPQ